MSKKKIFIFTIISLLLLTNFFAGIKLIKYRNKLKKPPLIEKIYSKTGKEVNYENPIVFTGNSMIHRMNWNFVFRKVSKDSLQIPIIINRGIGGNKTADLKRRLQSNILELNPRAVFIEIGTNDLIKVNNKNKREKIKLVINNQKQIIRDILDKNKNIKVYIISILPVLENEIKNRTAIEINNELKRICDDYNNVSFIDCYHDFTDKNEIMAKQDYMIGPGTAHLNDKGYEKWAKILLPYVFEANKHSFN